MHVVVHRYKPSATLEHVQVRSLQFCIIETHACRAFKQERWPYMAVPFHHADNSKCYCCHTSCTVHVTRANTPRQFMLAVQVTYDDFLFSGTVSLRRYLLTNQSAVIYVCRLMQKHVFYVAQNRVCFTLLPMPPNRRKTADWQLSNRYKAIC